MFCCLLVLSHYLIKWLTTTAGPYIPMAKASRIKTVMFSTFVHHFHSEKTRLLCWLRYHAEGMESALVNNYPRWSRIMKQNGSMVSSCGWRWDHVIIWQVVFQDISNTKLTGLPWMYSQTAKCMGPIWVLSAPDGPHVGPMNLAISAVFCKI